MSSSRISRQVNDLFLCFPPYVQTHGKVRRRVGSSSLPYFIGHVPPSFLEDLFSILHNMGCLARLPGSERFSLSPRATPAFHLHPPPTAVPNRLLVVSWTPVSLNARLGSPFVYSGRSTGRGGFVLSTILHLLLSSPTPTFYDRPVFSPLLPVENRKFGQLS